MLLHGVRTAVTLDSETTLHENIMKETPDEECGHSPGPSGQKVLFRSLKMVELFPRNTREPMEEEPPVNGEASWEEMGGGGGWGGCWLETGCSLSAMNGEVVELSQEEQACKTKEGMDLAKFDKWKNIFQQRACHGLS